MVDREFVVLVGAAPDFDVHPGTLCPTEVGERLLRSRGELAWITVAGSKTFVASAHEGRLDRLYELTRDGDLAEIAGVTTEHTIAAPDGNADGRVLWTGRGHSGWELTVWSGVPDEEPRSVFEHAFPLAATWFGDEGFVALTQTEDGEKEAIVISAESTIEQRWPVPRNTIDLVGDATGTFVFASTSARAVNRGSWVYDSEGSLVSHVMGWRAMDWMRDGRLILAQDRDLAVAAPADWEPVGVATLQHGPIVSLRLAG